MSDTTQTQSTESSCCAPSCCADKTKTAPLTAADSQPLARSEDNPASLREVVREKYGQAVKAVMQGQASSCCGSAAQSGPLSFTDPITADLYEGEQTAGLPEEALRASFGCGNPTALAELRPGEVVLDLGSGGGIDVLLSARRVGPTGKAFGLDMTDEMLELANQNKARAGAKNVEFLRGTIEDIPLPGSTVDVIISNCVINLSGDKDQVLREAFRVLKPGGRLAISDIVLRRPLGGAAQSSMALWTGCIAGALLDSEYQAKLAAAGFVDIGIEPTRIYDRQSVAEMAQGAASGCCGSAGSEAAETADETIGQASEQTTEQVIAALDGAVMSAFVRARKPAR